MESSTQARVARWLRTLASPASANLDDFPSKWAFCIQNPVAAENLEIATILATFKVLADPPKGYLSRDPNTLSAVSNSITLIANAALLAVGQAYEEESRRLHKPIAKEPGMYF